MKAIQHPAGFHYYLLRDIEDALEPELFAEFRYWLEGQTQPMGDNDELAVYKSDFDRWAQDNILRWD